MSVISILFGKWGEVFGAEILKNENLYVSTCWYGFKFGVSQWHGYCMENGTNVEMVKKQKKKFQLVFE